MNGISNILVASGNRRIRNSIEKLMSLSLEMKALFTDDFDTAVSMASDLLVLSDDILGIKDMSKLVGLANLKISVIYLVKEEDYDYAFYKCYSYGILILKDTIPDEMLLEVMKLGLQSARRKKKADTVYEKKAELSLIDAAKLLIIVNEGKTEAEAHKYVEKYAMDLRIPKIRAAKGIIGRYISYE